MRKHLWTLCPLSTKRSRGLEENQTLGTADDLHKMHYSLFTSTWSRRKTSRTQSSRRSSGSDTIETSMTCLRITFCASVLTTFRRIPCYRSATVQHFFRVRVYSQFCFRFMAEFRFPRITFLQQGFNGRIECLANLRLGDVCLGSPFSRHRDHSSRPHLFMLTIT